MMVKLGIGYLYKGQNAKSKPWLLRVLKYDETNKDALCNLGWIFSKEAEEFESSDPEKSKAKFDLDKIHLSSGLDILDSDIGSVAQVETHNARYYQQLAVSYLKTGDYETFDAINQVAANRGIFPSKFQRSSYGSQGKNIGQTD